MKVRDVFVHWPPHKWAPDDRSVGALTTDPGELQLLWFSAPDDDGWFSLTAIDSRGASWSTYCRAPTLTLWNPLERALGESLRVALELVGDVDLQLAARKLT